MTNRPKKKKRPETRESNRRNGLWVTTTITVPADVYADFKKFAEAENRTRRQQIRHLIESFVEEKKAAA